MHSQVRIFNGHALPTAQLKSRCLQLLIVAFACLCSSQIYAQCPPDNILLADINHSLDPMTCESVLDITDVHGNNSLDGCGCDVTILDEHDNELPAAFDFSDVGETFRYQVCCPLVVGEICAWANITVEFKGNSQFICPAADTVLTSSCIEVNDLFPPVIGSQCVEAGVILVNEIENLPNCVGGVQRQLIRTYQLTGPQGPIEQFCTQRIDIVAADLTNIIFPEKATINCDQDPTVELTGAPIFTTMINGVLDSFELTPDGLPLECSVFVSFEDTEFETACGSRITRMWSVGQWSCIVDTVQRFPQIIDITDLNPPTIECPQVITSSTTTHKCQVVVNLPPATVSDDCSDDLTVFIATNNGILNANGGVATIDTGFSQIIYSVSDCINTDTCVINVMLTDTTPPVAICETDITIGYAGVGNTFLDAYKIDAGSFDDCGAVKFGIARMVDTLDIPDHVFQDRIEILCEDTTMPFMAILQLLDSEGNVSFCMVEVTVTNKLIPTLICPAPDTVACDTIFDPDNLNVFFNPFEIDSDVCLDGFTVRDILIGDRNDCGVGTLERRIRILDAQGDPVGPLCRVDIVFEAPSTSLMLGPNFPPMDMCTPQDVCSLDDLDNFDIEFDIDQQRCQLLGISTEINEVTPPSQLQCPNPTSVPICQQFVRTFTVIDWCAIDGLGSKAEPFVFEQSINIGERTAPTATDPDDLEFCVPIDECDSLFVTIAAPTVTDNCAGDILTEFELFNDNDPANPILDMEGAVVTGNFDVGSYSIVWTFTDACGNFTSETQRFQVQNCKAPTITCIAGLAIPIVPNNNVATLELKQVVVYSGNSCGDQTGITESFEPDRLEETITFPCDSVGLGPLSVNVFATDTDGNQSKCTVLISLSDNGLCPNTAFTSGNNEARVSVSGNVVTPANTGITGADVALIGSSNTISTFTEKGNYLFTDMPTGGSYTIRPSFDDDVLNGVSIIDMILIQQHILNFREITNPYLLLAADVNGNGEVSIADVILLQRIALGLSDLPPTVPNWRFIDADADFFDATNPFSSSLSSEKLIDELLEDEVYNFIGIKAGDINMSALADTENRSVSNAYLRVDNSPLNQDKTTIPFYLSEQMTSIKGVSIEMNVSELNLLDLHSAQLKDGTFSIDVTDGQLKFISVNEHGMSVDSDLPLFELVLNGNSTATAKELLQDVTITVARELHGELQEQKVNIVFDSQVSGNEILDVVPNPWKDITTIEINSSEKTTGALLVTDLGGNVVYQNDVQFSKGINSLTLSSEVINVPGVYFIHVNTPLSRQTVKMIKLE